VPLAAGEEWGQRWDFNRLVENHDIDYNRCTLPNVGGITEFLKIMALCETHVVGMVPHFTGHFHRRPGELPRHLPRSGAVRVQLWRPGHRLLAGVPGFQAGKVYTNERPALAPRSK